MRDGLVLSVKSTLMDCQVKVSRQRSLVVCLLWRAERCEKEDVGRRRDAESLNLTSFLFPEVFPITWDDLSPVARPRGGVCAGCKVRYGGSEGTSMRVCKGREFRVAAQTWCPWRPSSGPEVPEGDRKSSLRIGRQPNSRSEPQGGLET